MVAMKETYKHINTVKKKQQKKKQRKNSEQV